MAPPAQLEPTTPCNNLPAVAALGRARSLPRGQSARAAGGRQTCKSAALRAADSESTKSLDQRTIERHKTEKATLGVPAIEQVHPKRRAFNQKRYNISVLCRFYFYIIFSIA